MSSLGVACAVVVASVCLHDAREIRFTDSSNSSSAEVNGIGYTARIIYGSDVISAPDWTRMNTACEDGVCVAYHKWCRNEGTFCRYQFSQPGDMQNTVIEITALDHAAPSRSESSVAVLAGNGWKMTEVPLTRFYVVSSTEDPPYCKPRQPQSACWPSSKK